MPGNYNNLKNLQMAQALSRGSGFTPAQQRGEESYNTPYDALNEAMGAPGMANPLNGLSSQGISSTPWATALSAGGSTSRPPNQNQWSPEQLGMLKRLQPQDRQKLLEELARQSAPAASPQEIQQKFQQQQQSQPRSYARPFEAPASGFTQKMIDNHPLTLLKNYIMGK
jgi:hypothetical protein